MQRHCNPISDRSRPSRRAIFTIVLFALVPALLDTAPAAAQSPAVQAASSGFGVLDVTPAATLLLPYFEVDLLEAAGVNTRFWVHNAVAEPELVNVTLWTDYGEPTYVFQIYLSGFDVVEVDLGRILRDGVLPGRPGTPSSGPLSRPQTEFPGCAEHYADAVPSEAQDLMRAAHTGETILDHVLFSLWCMGRNVGDGKARGFVTVDVMNDCIPDYEHPVLPGYFIDAGSGAAANRNSIWGDFVFTNLDGGDNAYGASLVHIEAMGSINDGFWDAQEYSFYGNSSLGLALDNREPLPTTWLVRYETTQPPAQEASFLIYWRDVFDFSRTRSLYCSLSTPAPFPMSAQEEIFFDDSEQATVTATSPFSPAPPGTEAVFAYAAGRVDLDAVSPFTSGWAWFNLNTTVVDGYFNPARQAYVGVVYRRSDDFVHAGTQAVPIDNALKPNVVDPEP